MRFYLTIPTQTKLVDAGLKLRQSLWNNRIRSVLKNKHHCNRNGKNI